MPKTRVVKPDECEESKQNCYKEETKAHKTVLIQANIDKTGVLNSTQNTVSLKKLTKFAFQQTPPAASRKMTDRIENDNNTQP
jgi:hypothetical protein